MILYHISLTTNILEFSRLWPIALLSYRCISEYQIYFFLGDNRMGNIKKTLKTGLAAGLVGLGLLSIEKRHRISSKISTLLQSMEIGPFPGTHFYSFLISKHFRQMYNAIAEEIINAGSYRHILDIGTGTGFLPIEIALLNPDIHIFGIDESAEMIQIANINSKTHGTGKSVDYSASSYINLPFPGMYFDFAVNAAILNRWKDPLAILDEVYYMLAPGGEFRIYGYRTDIQSSEWKSLEEMIPAIYRPVFSIGPEASASLSRSKDEMLDIVSQSRFDTPVIEDRTFNIFSFPMPIFYMIKMHKTK